MSSPARRHVPGRRGGLVALVLCALAIVACDDGSTGPSDELAFQCVGMDVPRCERILEEARQPFGGIPVVSAVIRCTVQVCSDASGEASVSVVFADGRRTDYGTGWAEAGPGVAEPPVRPDQPVPIESVPAQPT